MTAPLVSVIIPVFNRAHSVARSIESVLQQTYKPIEIIVVDDGSTDGTSDVLAEFIGRIHVIEQPNGGPSLARNTGASRAKGEIIAFLDSDDTWTPDKLERQVKLIVLGGNRVACCVCNARTIIHGVSSGTSFKTAGLNCGLTEGYWLNPTDLIATRFLLFNQVVAIRRSAFEKIGGFNNNMRILEDHDLAFRLSLLGPWAFVSEPLVTKYDEPDGLGVLARKDPHAHAVAWGKALQGFLHESLEDRTTIQRFIRRGLDDVSIEIRAVEMMRNGGLISRSVASFLLVLLRIKGAVRRRLPSWPQANAVASLIP